GGGNDNLAYRVYGRGFTRGPQFHSDGRDFDDWRRGQAGFRMDWTPDNREVVTVSGNVYHTDAGSKLAISTYSPPRLTNLEANGEFSGQNVLGEWWRKFDNGSDLGVRAYFDRTNRQDLNYHEVRDTVDLDFIHHVPLGSHDLIWGAGLRVSPSSFTQTVPTVDFLPHSQTYSIYSGFAQDDISLLRRRL